MSTSPMSTSQLVPMLAPDGTPGYIPADRVKEAVAAGGRQAVGILAPDGTRGIVPMERVQDALKAGGTLIGAPPSPNLNLPQPGPVNRFSTSFDVNFYPGAASAQPPQPKMTAEQIIARGQQPMPVPFGSPSGIASAANEIGQQFASGDVAGGLGAVAGTAAQMALLGRISKRIQGPVATPGPLGEMVNQPRGVVAPESASPVELKAYADQNGIPLNAAQATEHNLPRNLQSAGERGTIGGTAIKAQKQTAQAAVVQHAQDLMTNMSPGTPDLATAGEVIKQNVQQALERQQLAARHNYADVDQAANGVTVDLRPVKQQAGQLLQQSNFLRNTVPTLDAKRAATILRGMAQLPDNATFSQVQDLRSALLDESRHPDNAISEKAQGWLKQVSGATDQQMMQAANSSPGLRPVFRLANQHWEALQNDFNNPRSPLFQILQEPDPSKVPQKLTAKGQIGGSPYNIGLLTKYGIDTAPVKWTVTGDMLQKNFGLYNGGKTLAGYSDDFLRTLYTPAELQAIYKTGAIARSVGLNVNPSGTAGAMSAIEDIRHPLASAPFKAGAAKLTNSPGFNRWLMGRSTPFSLSPGVAVPAAGLSSLFNLMTAPREQQ